MNINVQFEIDLIEHIWNMTDGANEGSEQHIWKAARYIKLEMTGWQDRSRLCVWPVDWKTPGLHWQYREANASIIRSIFWASPGKRKLHRNCLW